jgi:hypothetical protein
MNNFLYSLFLTMMVMVVLFLTPEKEWEPYVGFGLLVFILCTIRYELHELKKDKNKKP